MDLVNKPIASGLNPFDLVKEYLAQIGPVPEKDTVVESVVSWFDAIDVTVLHVDVKESYFCLMQHMYDELI